MQSGLLPAVIGSTSKVALLVLSAALIACDDGAEGTAPRVPTTVTSPAVQALRATVDFSKGTLSFDPLRAGPAARGSSAVSPAIYGDQGLTVRIYNSAVTVTNPSSPGKKRYTANVGIRNLLAYPIGDEQGGPAPADTSGIFVFMNGGPTVGRTSSPCAPACAVTIANAHGRLAFTAPNQAYWYWNDRLAAFGGGRDTTLTRRSWTFEADTQVTSFTFDVLVSAAWPSPHQARWKIEFTGDSLPHTTSEPDWERTMVLTGTVSEDAANPGSVIITVPSNGYHHFLRRDSLGSATNAYMEARLIVNQANPKPDVGFVLDDNVRLIAVGLTGTRVGFVDNAQNFLGTAITATTTSFQTYRLVKFGADSVQLLLNGSRVASRAYSGFSPSDLRPYSYFQFGTPGQAPGPNSSSWDYVAYEIGVTAP